MPTIVPDYDPFRVFEKEKKALVPERDYLDGHPFEEKIRRVCFKAELKHPGHDPARKFNEGLQNHFDCCQCFAEGSTILVLVLVLIFTF